MSKIMILMTTSKYVLNFRKGLILSLMEKGNEVVVVAGDDKRREDVERLGATFVCVKQNNRGLNPFSTLTSSRKLTKVIKNIAPDVVFTFQLKPNTFGVLAAKKAKVKKIFAMVEGLGEVFILNTVKWKIVRAVVCRLYKKSLKNVQTVFFLNNEDKREFIKRKLVVDSQCEIINGIGVDLVSFNYNPPTSFDRVIMVARMLESKGIYDFCKTARLVKNKYPNIQFDYVGAESTVKVADIKEYVDDGSINYLGEVDDVKPYIRKAFIMLLPSYYREGLPRSIMEAEALGKVIITTNNVGCKETVVDGYNGFLCDIKNTEQMAERIIWCIEHIEDAKKMCENSRKFAENNFDEKLINERIYHILKR